MWIKLGNEYLNLDHVVRVRFNKGWKNGSEELVAEVDGLVKGEVQVFTRYRHHDAAALQTLLGTQANPPEAAPDQAHSAPHMAAPVAAASTGNTLHDF